MTNFLKENWFKLGILIVLLIIASAIFYYCVYFIPQNKQANLTSSEIEISAENQNSCARQAESFFNKAKTKGDTYTNHYNNELRKCFILISSITSNNRVIITKGLYNITENSHYAGYYKSIPPGTTDENTKPQNCWYLDKYCQTEQEFNNFVSSYMNN